MFIGYYSLWTLGFLIGCQVLTTSAVDTVPILLWDDYGKTSSFEPFNPFHTTSEDEFEEIMKRKLENSSPPLLVLVKDNFCIEDFTQNKENFVDLKNASVLQLSAVKTPLSFFENLSSYELLNVKKLESIGENQLAIVQVENVDEALKMYKTIRESSPNLVTVLTGNSCASNLPERVRRAAKAEMEASNDTALFFNSTDGKILLYSSQLPVIKTSQNGSFEPMTISSAESGNDSVILMFQAKSPNDSTASVKFNFTLSGGYYKLGNVTYNNVNKTRLVAKKQIYMPRKFSYQCNQETIFENNFIKLNFTDIQMQFDADGKFGDSYNCVGFTSIPIWTGLFVTVILALIMIWALTMIMDIRTMDRFDDPKGKTITISATD